MPGPSVSSSMVTACLPLSSCPIDGELPRPASARMLAFTVTTGFSCDILAVKSGRQRSTVSSVHSFNGERAIAEKASSLLAPALGEPARPRSPVGLDMGKEVFRRNLGASAVRRLLAWARRRVRGARHDGRSAARPASSLRSRFLLPVGDVGDRPTRKCSCVPSGVFDGPSNAVALAPAAACSSLPLHRPPFPFLGSLKSSVVSSGLGPGVLLVKLSPPRQVGLAAAVVAGVGASADPVLAGWRERSSRSPRISEAPGVSPPAGQASPSP